MDTSDVFLWLRVVNFAALGQGSLRFRDADETVETPPSSPRSLLEMYGRVVALMGLALCGVLAGCSSSRSVPKHAPGPGPALPITVHAGTLASWTSLIEAAVPMSGPERINTISPTPMCHHTPAPNQRCAYPKQAFVSPATAEP